MPTFIAGLFALYLVLAAIKQFGRLSPATAAKIARKGGAALSLLGVVLFALRGGFGFASVLANLALGLAGWNKASPFGAAFRAAGPGARAERITTARSATIEMRLDHDSGALSGSVLAGPFQGRALDMLARPDCLALYATSGATIPRAPRYWRLISTAGLPAGVRQTRVRARRGGGLAAAAATR